MRANSIGNKVLDLLDERKYREAFDLFREECDDFQHCELGQDDVSNCVKLCLLPKLLHYSLLNNCAGMEERINNINELTLQ